MIKKKTIYLLLVSHFSINLPFVPVKLPIGHQRYAYISGDLANVGGRLSRPQRCLRSAYIGTKALRDDLKMCFVFTHP